MNVAQRPQPPQRDTNICLLKGKKAGHWGTKWGKIYQETIPDGPRGLVS